jgi:hypothetical protein
MHHLIKKLLPSVAVALTVRSSCACLAAGLHPSRAPGLAPNSSGGSRPGQWNRRCKSGAVPWAPPMRTIGHQTTLAASLKPCTRRTTVDRSNPCQSTISCPPTRHSGAFRTAQTSISADLSSISCVPSASSMYGMHDSTSPGAMVTATEARPWFSAPMGPKAISHGSDLP